MKRYKKPSGPNPLGGGGRYPLERKYEMNLLHWERGYSIHKLKENGFSEAVVFREVFHTRKEWEQFKETFTGTLNPKEYL